MKKYFALCLVLVLMLTGCTAPAESTEPPETQYVMTESNYQFPNGSSMRTVYQLDEAGRVCGYTLYYNGSEEADTTVTYTFDDHGYHILETTVSDGVTQEEETRNTYDEAGRRIRAESDGSVMEYTYEDGVLATLTQTQDLGAVNGTWTIVTRYNANGEIISSETTDSDGSVPSSVTQTFDENGRLVKAVQVQYGAEKTETVPEYDAQGRMARSTQTYYNADGEAHRVLVDTFTYSADGLVCTKITRNGDRETGYQVTTYDEAGNILKEEFGRPGAEGYYCNTFAYQPVPAAG